MCAHIANQVAPAPGVPTPRSASGPALPTLGRFALPREVTDTALWLASDAAGMISGVDVPVDGGYTMG